MMNDPTKAPALTAADVQREVRALANPEKARSLQRFFKTGAGQYGEGDRFLGLTVPVVRGLVRRFENMSLPHVKTLLRSVYHEERLLALLLLVRKYGRGTEHDRAAVLRMYLANLRYVNNWDLVDCSAEQIVGRHLTDSDRALLYEFVESPVLWERRIAMVATFAWIKQHDFKDALAIAARLLNDREDLIHKATGWMLRETGKRNPDVLRRFLRKHCSVMPRTALRYAIERFTDAERKRWLRCDPSL